MRRWDEGRRRNGVCAPLHGKGWRSGPVRGPMGGSFKPASAVARIGGTQAGFYGHGVPALSRCAHADDATSPRRCLSRQEGPGGGGSSSRAAGGAPALRSSLGGSSLPGRAPGSSEAMCVCSPMLRDAESRGRPLSQELRALRKRRAAGERLRTKPREGDIDENLPSLREHPVR